MRPESHQYTNPTERSYDRAGDVRQLVGKVVEVEGAKYNVLSFVDRARTGYQGTIYPHVESNEIVVAHQQLDAHRLQLTEPATRLESQAPAELTR